MIPARRMPVNDPVKLTYKGVPMFHNAFRGPVSGKGYLAQPGETIDVERIDVDALLALESWSKPKRPRKKRSISEVVEE